VATTSFTADNKADLSTQVTQCKDAGADLVFLPIYYTEASQILSYANKIGYAPKFFGCDGMDGILTVEGFDTSLAEGLVLMTPFDANAFRRGYPVLRRQVQGEDGWPGAQPVRR